jgi:hypothetical protein
MGAKSSRFPFHWREFGSVLTTAHWHDVIEKDLICDSGGGQDKGKAGAGGAYGPLQMTNVDVSKRCGFREARHVAARINSID